MTTNSCRRTNADYVFSPLIVKSRKTKQDFVEQQKEIRRGHSAFNKMTIRFFDAIVPGSLQVKEVENEL